jgi:transposase
MQRVEQHADGTTTTTTVAVKAERKTYAQPDWSAYHAHQTNERRHFLQLLADLCATIPERPTSPKGGRPPIPMRDSLFAAVMKVYSLTSARRFSGELEEVHEAGFIRKFPRFNTVLDVFDKPETTPILKSMIQVSAAPLAAVVVDFAVDSTGFATTSYQSWCEFRHGNKIETKRAKFVKAHFATGVVSNTVTAVEILDQHAADSPQLPGLVNTTRDTFRIRDVSADKAYVGSSNFAAVDAVGGTFFPAFKDNTTGESASDLFRKAFHWFQMNKDEYLKRYHKRSNIESTVSMIKRKLGDSVKSKGDRAQANEVYAKFVAHNLMVLVAEIYATGLNPIFPAETSDRQELEAPAILRFPTRL